MAPITTLLPIAREVAKTILGSELVNRAVDHWVANNEINGWDKLVWEAIESLLGIPSHDWDAAAREKVAAIQADYDTMPESVRMELRAAC